MFIIMELEETIGVNVYKTTFAVAPEDSTNDNDDANVYNQALASALLAYKKGIIGRKLTNDEKKLWESTNFSLLAKVDELPELKSPIKVIEVKIQ